MFGFIALASAIVALVALVGTFVRLPIFGRMRRIGLAVLALTVVAGPMLANAVRTPEEVAQHAAIDANLENAETAERAERPSSGGDAEYSDTAVIAAAQSAVKRKLVDDGSARFRDVSVVVQSSGAKAVCGEVNAKNRAGGYAGYQHFISAGTEEHTYLEEQVPDFASAWNELCVR